MEVLPEIVEAVRDQMEVLLDSGVRRGKDVVKALALGAKAVLVGRYYVWGLAVGGQAGVSHVLEQLRGEVKNTLQLMGCPSVHDLDPSWIARANTKY
jgi:isopentenyl diphosphate isomerase/L-lactate dehydrogenase-like FMN-dependent dehydrogenase